MKFRKALLIGALALVPLALSAKVEVGQPAPDFTLTSQDGNQVSLSQFKGHWVVLYFYPKDFTSGCTVEAHKFQDDQDKYKALDAAIVGVSVDTADSHKQFCTKEGLTFKLLADPTAKVPAEYDSIMEYQGTKLAARHTFLIDPSGKVVKSYMEVNPKNHSEQVLADLASLQKK
ncbi:alkyl hydroperoxide reductase/ Thiol specific antioxidant/ Mal allergen [Candidatus Koribacter versatilis Ellin345]|uniref:thioredoxin-dependent peroxiredoxin n=1 Tax=Koribacter versatilis (strain Ellin345) TaxID=204669 RepID=Q1IMT4_KORVE|nr:peroxiredoxin [Candidatus Koribacter versatilis]ABF41816.1 alkyl hydroperoxide reductase/ Thiol specific antioxidant/ Mal allergen [Candidatus Koribacter versatilis Ellin345]